MPQRQSLFRRFAPYKSGWCLQNKLLKSRSLFFTNLTRIPPVTRLRLDMMISRHALTAIAIPSLRSLQIWVVPPKQTPQIEGFVFTDITRIPPVTRLRLDMMISRHALTAIAIPSLRQSIASLPYASLVLTNSNGESKRCCRYLIYKMCKKLLLFSPRLSRI